MTLKDLMKVLPAYTQVYVHDKDGKAAYKGNPHEFVMGLYKSLDCSIVLMAVPIHSYTMEITIKEVSK